VASSTTQPARRQYRCRTKTQRTPQCDADKAECVWMRSGRDCKWWNGAKLDERTQSQRMKMVSTATATRTCAQVLHISALRLICGLPTALSSLTVHQMQKVDVAREREREGKTRCRLFAKQRVYYPARGLNLRQRRIHTALECTEKFET